MKKKIIDYIRRNRVCTTEVADCLGKTGVLENVMPINRGHFKVGNVKWVYADHGELVSKYILLYRQANAIISNAKFRDAAALIRENYPIWSTGFTPVGCFNKEPKEPVDPAWLALHRSMYDGAIAVCDDCGVVIIPKECHTEEFYQKLVAIEEQEDTWFDRLDHYKDNTFDIVCLKTYLKEPRR